MQSTFSLDYYNMEQHHAEMASINDKSQYGCAISTTASDIIQYLNKYNGHSLNLATLNSSHFTLPFQISMLETKGNLVILDSILWLMRNIGTVLYHKHFHYIVSWKKCGCKQNFKFSSGTILKIVNWNQVLIKFCNKYIQAHGANLGGKNMTITVVCECMTITAVRHTTDKVWCTHN